MAELVITRTKSFMAKRLPFTILIDGVKVGMLKNGETKSFEIPTGTHQVQIGYGKKAEKFGAKEIVVAQDPIAIKTEITNSFLGLLLIGAGSGLVGGGLTRGGLSITGIAIAIIGMTLMLITSKSMNGKVCKII